jgi:hypothetical protein
MSFEAMSWASKQRTGNSSRKLVLLSLANHTNGHTGQCNPRIKLIAHECEMSERSVRDHLRALEADGFIRGEEQFYHGIQLPTQYFLLMDGVQEFHHPRQNLPHPPAEFAPPPRQNLPPYNQEDINQENNQESANALLRGKRIDVPAEQIVELYNSILSDRLPKAIKLDDSRKRSIAARWKEMLKSKAYLDEESGLVWWTDFFRRVRLNPHWLGDNDRKWTASLNWLLDTKNFTKVLEYRASTFMTKATREELNRAANRTIGVGEQWDAPPPQRVIPDPLLLEGEYDELPY